MNIAVYHNLVAGGAPRVLHETVARLGQHRFETFLPDRADDTFAPLKPFSKKVHRFSTNLRHGRLSQYDIMTEVPRYGREIARAIDAGGFDAVLVGASQVTQAAEILPYLKTPSVYYAPEHSRGIYDGLNVPPKLSSRLLIAPRYAWIKRFDRKAIRSATLVMAHSRYAAKLLNRYYGVDPRVNHLGVDTELYRPARRKRANFMLSVGSLEPVKGHQFVIEAVSLMPPSSRPAVTVIGNRGSNEAELVALAKGRGVRLTIKHNIPFPEVVKLYTQALLLAAAQINEPFGLITLEAMATKTPIVAVRDGGLAETVTNGKTGLLVPRNPQRFADAVQKVIKSKRLGERLGAAGLAEAETRWQWQRTADRLEKLLIEVAR